MASFEKYYPRLKKWEGGYGNYAEDPGGCTNRGITIHTWRKFGYDKNGDGIITCEDVRQISREDAKNIYQKYFGKQTAEILLKTKKLPK